MGKNQKNHMHTFKSTTNSTPSQNCLLKHDLELGVRDIEKKWYLDILGDFFDNDNSMIFCALCYCANIWLPYTTAVFNIRHILCGQFTSVIEINIFI